MFGDPAVSTNAPLVLITLQQVSCGGGFPAWRLPRSMSSSAQLQTVCRLGPCTYTPDCSSDAPHAITYTAERRRILIIELITIGETMKICDCCGFRNWTPTIYKKGYAPCENCGRPLALGSAKPMKGRQTNGQDNRLAGDGNYIIGPISVEY